MTAEAVFPDWSPYPKLDDAARAYLRDPEIAMESLDGALRGAEVRGFTLERFVNEHNGVWQEVAVCDGSRLLLWHGEDCAPGEGPPGSMISSLRIIPLTAVTEIGCRRRLVRTAMGHRVDSVDVYFLLGSLEENDHAGPRHDALRFGKTLTDGGAGQIARLEEFTQLISGLVGRPVL